MKISKIKIKIILFFIITIIACKSTDRISANHNKKIYIYSGIIEKITKFPGTFSEYSFYILKPDKINLPYKDIILFNKDDNTSRGFDEYVDKKVKITGKEITGYIGWRKLAKSGILVEKITIIK